MAQQRNNIARLPWEIREIVCRLRFDGRGNQEIARAVQAACRAAAITPPKIHGTSILAYSRGAEYREYCDHRRQWDERMAPRRWAAALVNEGKGPQTVADLAELEILEQLHALAAGGLLETGRDVATVARAITSMQRTQLMRRDQAAEERVRAIESEHEAAVAAMAVTVRELQERIQQLENPGLGDGSAMTDAEKAQRIKERLGIQ